MITERFEFENGFIEAQYDLLDDSSPVSFIMSHRNMVSRNPFSLRQISLADNRLAEISDQLNRQLDEFHQIGFGIKSIDSASAIIWVKNIVDKIVV